MADEPVHTQSEPTPTTPPPTPVVQEPVASKMNISAKDLLIPLSIIIAGVAIGAGMFLSGGDKAPVAQKNTGTQVEEPTGDPSKIDPVTEKDHYVGNLNAPVKIVEYSDFECPFCKKFHTTIEAVAEKYGDDVVWVYRQFPLEQLHQKAMPVALASECAAELGGNKAFWTFTNNYFDQSLSNDRTNIDTLIPKLVAEAGLNPAKFNECFESGRHQEIVNTHIADAVETGGRGTPWTIVIGPDGKTYPVNGAQPQSVLDQTVKTALESK